MNVGPWRAPEARRARSPPRPPPCTAPPRASGTRRSAPCLRTSRLVRPRRARPRTAPRCARSPSRSRRRPAARLRVAGFAEHPQVAGIVKAHPARALDDRLDDHGRELAGVRLDEPPQLPRTPRPRPRGTRPAAAPRTPASAAPRPTSGACPVGVAHRHGHERVAVVPAAPGQQPRLRPAPRERQYCRHIFTATSTETGRSRRGTRAQARRGERHQPVGQGHGGLVRQPAEHHVADPPQLLAGRRVERRVPVPVNRRPPGAHAVDQLPAVGQPQPHPARRLDDQRPARPGIGAYGCHNPLSVQFKQLFRRSHAGDYPERARRARSPPTLPPGGVERERFLLLSGRRGPARHGAEDRRFLLLSSRGRSAGRITKISQLIRCEIFVIMKLPAGRPGARAAAPRFPLLSTLVAARPGGQKDSGWLDALWR